LSKRWPRETVRNGDAPSNYGCADCVELRGWLRHGASVAGSIGSIINGPAFAGLSSISLEYCQHLAKRYEVTEAIERRRVQI
jgi:hypothetical protein